MARERGVSFSIMPVVDPQHPSQPVGAIKQRRPSASTAAAVAPATPAAASAAASPVSAPIPSRAPPPPPPPPTAAAADAPAAVLGQESAQRSSVLAQFPAPPLRSPTRLQARKASLSIAIRPYSANMQLPPSLPPPAPAAAAAMPKLTVATAATTAAAVATPTTASASAPRPDDAAFFTALAAQERRVMELREDLSKAEHELMALKKQWVSHEVTRRRSDVPAPSASASVAATPTSAATSASSDLSMSSNLWLQHERERRQSLTRPVSASGRRVFSSSKSPRPLSLVSPLTAPIKRMSDPSPDTAADFHADSRSETSETSATADALEALNSGRSNVADAIHTIPEEASVLSLRTTTDAVSRKSLQLASDIREGLWTFFEDPQQATPEDEALQPRAPTVSKGSKRVDATARSRSAGQRSSPRAASASRAASVNPPKRSRNTLIEVGGVLYNHDGRHHSVATPSSRRPSVDARRQSTRPTRRAEDGSSKTQTIFFDDDPWDDWDAAAARGSHHQKYPSSSRSASSDSQCHDSPSTINTGLSSSRSSVDETMSRGSSTLNRSYKPSTAGAGASSSSGGGGQWSHVSKRASQLHSSAAKLMDHWQRGITPTDHE